MPLNGRRICIILLWCLSLTPGTLFASAEVDYEKALQAFQQNEQQAAYIHLKNVLQQAPDPAIRFHIAYTLVKLQCQAEAIELLQQLLANSNDFTEKQQATQLLEQLVAANSA
jgi:thioredoxin-like negative regulator of GroEL